MLLFDSACDFVGKARGANLARAKQLGCSAISLYIVGTPGGCAHATKDDVATIHSLGMGVFGNWERAADFFRGATIAQCQAAGAEALQAMGDLGFPEGTACAPSWDYDVLAGDYAAELAKAKAFAKGLTSRYDLSAYAELGLIAYFIDHGAIPAGVKGWLCMSEGFGGFNGDWGKYVAMVQQHNASKQWLNPTQPGTDINTVIDPHALGAWWPAGSPYAGGDDMSAADVKAITDYIDVKLGKRNDVTGLIVHGDDEHPNSLDSIGVLVRAALTKDGAKIDTKAVAAALAPAVVAALQGKVGLTQAEVEQAVADVINHIEVSVPTVP